MVCIDVGTFYDTILVLNKFGLNHIGGIKGYIGSYLSYKYNGKELQESGFYDYGARMYMADLGRWGVVDNYSENYNSMSPYNYVAGNPIKFIDINGEWIYINDEDGTQYRYHNGATQHQVNGKWTNVDESTKLSDYVVKAVAGLNYLDKNTSIGNTMINYFDQGQGKDGKMRDNIVDLNTLSTKGVWTTAGKDGQYSPLYTTIGHEMAHIYGYFALGQIAQSDERFGDESTTAEIFGTHAENIIRAETGLPLRTHYKTIIDGVGKQFPANGSRLIDSVGNSIFYNSSGNQITPIPSLESVLRVNNSILQNKYNYYGGAVIYHLQKFKNLGH
ncbi:hypothetical protein DRF59_12935 [Chryseobacterium flavum]|uniref:RHS repeat-associated core domain-containing protein n=1 Tax=Chryseobacterium flavum TaxID=415851 RepID=A0A3D9CKV1_9FLAO|nr:hypothetical protein DRF59_12935 [Chryseobacterium flavum]